MSLFALFMVTAEGLPACSTRGNMWSVGPQTTLSGEQHSPVVSALHTCTVRNCDLYSMLMFVLLGICLYANTADPPHPIGYGTLNVVPLCVCWRDMTSL